MANTASVIGLLRTWVGRQLPAEALAWLDAQIAKLGGKPADKDVYLALGYATRRLGKADLELRQEDLAAARAARPDWDPKDWSVDQASRLAFVLASFDGDLGVRRNGHGA